MNNDVKVLVMIKLVLIFCYHARVLKTWILNLCRKQQQSFAMYKTHSLIMRLVTHTTYKYMLYVYYFTTVQYCIAI